MCRGLQIKATFYDFSSLFAHLLTMFSFVVFPPRKAKMVIIGGDADGNEEDVFFSLFSVFLSCFQLMHVC